MFVEGAEVDPTQLAAEVVTLVARRDRVDADLILALAKVIETNTYSADGSTSPLLWLRRRVDLDRAEAQRLVSAATRLALAPLVTAAVASGQVSARRGVLLTRPLANERVREAFAAAEGQLLTDTAEMSAEGVARHAAMWERQHDENAERPDVAVNRVRVHTDRLGRKIVHAILEPAGGTIVEVELRGIAGQIHNSGTLQPDGEQLTGAELLGAALVEMASRSSGNDRHNPDAPTVIIEIPEDRLDDFLDTNPDVTFDDDAAHDRDDDHGDGCRGGNGQDGEGEGDGDGSSDGCGGEQDHGDDHGGDGCGDGGGDAGGCGDHDHIGDHAGDGSDDGCGAEHDGDADIDGDGDINLDGDGAFAEEPGDRRFGDRPSDAGRPDDGGPDGSEPSAEHPEHRAGGEGCCGAPRPTTPATVDGAFLSNAAMRRLLCDSLVVALVVGSDGRILRLGRLVRTATKEQRLLLALRDGGCVFPGCTMPSYRCRAHHIRWWVDDGPTDISNMCLCCDVHHAEIHGHRWTVEQTDTGHRWRHLRTGRVEHTPFHRGLTSDPPFAAAA
jgi:hypothetical protein